MNDPDVMAEFMIERRCGISQRLIVKRHGQQMASGPGRQPRDNLTEFCVPGGSRGSVGVRGQSRPDFLGLSHRAVLRHLVCLKPPDFAYVVRQFLRCL
ncbi:hypothetical protein [Deinococcus fonticola]|uniref:hypothetical protein n=1 Tax=Deinococcus fonticola TaxID=2528713 RepID=UPI00143193FE|nr:hypothetical protein [Deinococcus fonticola]